MSSLKAKRRELLTKRIEIKLELLRRANRKKQQAPGGLYEFVKYFWPILEPKTKFVDGWAIRAICAHLEAVTRGEITRLLINVPPGFSKSLICNVFFPAWEWGPMGLTSMRYIAFSYGSHLTERDNGKFRDIIQSKKFQELWGDKFKTTGAGVVKVSNDKTGWKFASSVGGVGTGERADRVLCFPSDEMVQTETGPLAIGDLVRNKVKTRVYSVNRMSGKVELRNVVDWKHNPGSDLVRVNLSSGQSFRCTPHHEILTAFGTFIRACDLLPGDAVASVDERLLAGNCEPSSAAADGADGSLGNVELGSQGLLSAGAGHNCFNLLSRKFGLGPLVFSAKSSMSLGVGHVFGPCAVFEVAQVAVSSIAVFVSNLATCGAWANKGFQNHLVAEFVSALAVDAHCYPRVSFIQNGSEQFPCQAHRSAMFSWSNNYPVHTANPPLVRDVVCPVSANNGEPKFVTVASVERCGHADETFCLEVETNHNFILASCVVVRNCDDPHNLADGESDVIRTKTVRWFDEAMSNRLNDLKKSVIIVIMQRVAELDVSGHIVENEDDYTHLLIPMEFDGRVCQTCLGRDQQGRRIIWTDPREEIGELAWPERYGENVLQRFRRNAFMWAGQYQQTPEPRGGGLFKRDWWQYVEVPIGAPPPPMEYVVASLDSAYTKNERNDPSGFTVWGAYVDERDNPKIMMLGAWRKHLEIHGADVEREPGEHELDYKARAKKEWGLVEWVAHECKRHHVDMLLIEAKASGIDVGNEMRRLYANEGWGVELVDPKGGDKYARAVAQIHLFADGMVGVPVSHRNPKDRESELVPRDWAQLVIDETSIFPNGRFKDLTDSTTQALKHLRQIGFAIRRDERDQVRAIQAQHGTTRLDPLYEV